MRFGHVDPARIEREWPDFAEILAPAVRVHAATTMQEVFDDLVAGRTQMVECDGPEASGLLVFHVFDEGQGISCFASYIAGAVPGGPRRMVRSMQSLMAQFETVCRDAGISQIYIGGRDWRRVFPDYEPADGVVNRLRKVL